VVDGIKVMEALLILVILIKRLIRLQVEPTKEIEVALIPMILVTLDRKETQEVVEEIKDGIEIR